MEIPDPSNVHLECEHPLTVLGQSVSRSYVHRLFIFDFPDTSPASIERAVARIVHGLDIALQHYPFLTGKLGPAQRPNYVELRYSRTPECKVNSELFKVKVHKQDSETICYQDLCAKGMPVSHFDQTAFAAAPANVGPEDWRPAFTLQANFLEHGGGLVLCFSFQHSLVDGGSIMVFLDKFAQGNSLEFSHKCPVEYELTPLHDMFLNISSHAPTVVHLEWDFSDAPVVTATSKLTTAIIRFPAKAISALKDDLTRMLKEIDHNSFISTVDCISALLFATMLQARYARLNAEPTKTFVREHKIPAHFSTAVNARRIPQVPDDYFGNMFTTAAATFPLEDFVPRDLGSLESTTKLYARCAMEIRKKLGEVNVEYVVGRLHILESLADPLDASRAMARASQTSLGGVRFGSLVDFGADLDFGIPGAGTGSDGRARFIRNPWMKREGLTNILPRRGSTKGDADWEVLVCVTDAEMRFLLRELQIVLGEVSWVDDWNPQL